MSGPLDLETRSKIEGLEVQGQGLGLGLESSIRGVKVRVVVRDCSRLDIRAVANA